MSSSNCCFLTCIQISQEAGQVVWYSHLLKNFPQFLVIHTVKDFGIVNNAEIDVFLELSCFFHDPADVGNLISDSSAFSKTSLNIWKFMVHVLLKAVLENFEHYFTSTWDECNCAEVWTFFGIGTWNVRSMNQSKLEVVKQEMARVNIDVLGISELKWTGMGEFNSDDHYISTTAGRNPSEEME